MLQSTTCVLRHCSEFLSKDKNGQFIRTLLVTQGHNGAEHFVRLDVDIHDSEPELV